MNLFQRFRMALSTLAAPEPWLRESLGAMPTSSGKHVSPTNAMKVSAVYGCTTVLCQSVGCLPLQLLRRKSDGSYEPAIDHPLYSLLKDLPNSEVTSVEDREATMLHLVLRGRAFHQVVRSGGEIGEINIMLPDQTRMYRSRTGELAYEYTDDTGKQWEFNSSQVWRMIGLSANGLNGLTPISYARETIGLAMATEEHGSKLFTNGAQIPYAVSREGSFKANDPAYERLKKSFEKNTQGNANAWKPLLLEEGMKVTQLGMTGADSQFIESRKFHIEEICRFFRVPPHMIQHLDRATFNNIEHLSISFVQNTLVPWMTRYEQTIARDLLLPNERKKYIVRFNVDGFLRGDTLSRYNAYGQAILDGWMNRNEVRAKENLNKVDGLDEYLQPLNMISAKEAKKERNKTDPAPAPDKGENAYGEAA